MVLREVCLWITTPFRALVSIFVLNILAWAIFLFLLMCNFVPAMCWTPNDYGDLDHACRSLQSPRYKWIEIDQQILNALFCVPGLGLAPWRLRDQYFMIDYHFVDEGRYGRRRKLYGLRRLAGQHRTWIRLPESHTINCLASKGHDRGSEAARQTSQVMRRTRSEEADLRIPLPADSQPDPPVTGVRAPGTSIWKIDLFVGCQTVNALIQGCLCGVMWRFNRFNRPPWATGLCIALAVIVTAIGAMISYHESRRIKRIEGVSPSGDCTTMREAIHNTSEEEASTRAQRNRVRVVAWEQTAIIRFLEDSGMVFDVVFEILESLLGVITGTGVAFDALQEYGMQASSEAS